MFTSLPAEIRSLILQYTFEDTSIHVCDPNLHRAIGGPNRPKNRRLPGILHTSKQIRQESLPILAKEARLVFNDYSHFSKLVRVVPDEFARVVRRISLKGDVVETPSLEVFPALQHVTYKQPGNCLYAPSKANNFNTEASKATREDLIDAVAMKSPALAILSQALDLQKSGNVGLFAEANILSSCERISVTIDVNKSLILSQEILAVHRFF